MRNEKGDERRGKRLRKVEGRGERGVGEGNLRERGDERGMVTGEG